MAKYLHILTVYGTATGAVALKRVKHLIYELEKRILLRKGNRRFKTRGVLGKKVKKLEAEKKAIIEKIEMIKANTTAYGLLGKKYKIGKN